MKTVTIKDIAKEAGVSITAVSFVLNGKTNNVSKATAEKILEICNRCNFKPNYMASSLKSKSSKTVGCIIPDIENNYYSRLLSRLEEELNTQGYKLLITNSGYDINRCVEAISDLVNRMVDYLVIVPPSSFAEKEPSLEETVSNLSVPYVLLDRTIGAKDNRSILTDDVFGGYLATKYLINHNHKRIAVITGPSGISSSRDRLQGYKKALEEFGIAYDESIIFEGDYHDESGERCGREIIEKHPDVDAIFALNDIMAYGVYRVMNEHHIVIGHDISLVGYDDNYFSSLITPRLTTVRQDIDGLCRSVVDELFKDDETLNTILVTPTLIERESVKL